MNNELGKIILTGTCSGCFACASKCPTQALHMELDDEGFYYPVIAIDKCVNCGICERICPVINPKAIRNLPTYIYSSFSTDENIRINSSSGGIFALLANNILSLGGVVYGAAFDKDRKEVCHTSTDVTPLCDIMRSKYVQSRIGSVYGEVENNLKCDRHVLFSGTPCQIKGLKAFLLKPYNKLITVDFMCHGVPSTGLFKDVIEYYERTEKSNAVDFTFREKDLGWRNQVIKIYLSNGKVLSHKNSYYYYFYFLFLRNFTLRKSCLECPCYNTHESDITLADNWNIKDDCDKGVSLVLINTANGKKQFDAVSGGTATVNYSVEFKGFDYYCHKYSAKNRKRFFDYYLKNGSEKALKVFYKSIIRKDLIIKYLMFILRKIKRLVKKLLKL